MNQSTLLVLSLLLITGVLAEDQAFVIQAPEVKALPASELPATLKALAEGKENEDRLAALGQLKQFHFKPIPKEVSTAMVRRVIDDKEDDVRKAALQAIREMGDEAAKDGLVAAAVHPRLNDDQRKHAAKAVRALDDAGLVGAIVTMATYDVRTGTAIDFQPPRVRSITGPGVSLPIDLPDLELRSVSTSVATHAIIALKEISRRDFGGNHDAWKKWFEEWKQIREVRVAGKK